MNILIAFFLVLKSEMFENQLQQMRKKMVQKAKECMKEKASKSEMYGRMQDVFIEMEPSPKAYKHIPLIISSTFSLFCSFFLPRS